MAIFYKFCLSLILVWMPFLSFGQLIVNDTYGNTLKNISLKLQAVEKSTSTASKMILTAMSGDITNSLEILSEQNELFKNAQELKTTLGGIVGAVEAIDRVKYRLEKTYKASKAVEESIREFNDSERFSKEYIYAIQNSLSEISRTVEEANDIYRAATDVDDQISRIVRLEKIQESDNKMAEAFKELERLQEEINALKKKVDLRMYTTLMVLPPKPLERDIPGFNSNDNGMSLAQKTKYFHEINANIRKEAKVQSPRVGGFLELVINYTDAVFIIIISSIGIYMYRTRDARNIYGIIKTGFEVLAFYTILKIVIATLI